MANLAAPWFLSYYPISPFLCMDSSLKVVLCSSITAEAPAVKSTFQEGGNRREGWP